MATAGGNVGFNVSRVGLNVGISVQFSCVQIVGAGDGGLVPPRDSSKSFQRLSCENIRKAFVTALFSFTGYAPSHGNSRHPAASHGGL